MAKPSLETIGKRAASTSLNKPFKIILQKGVKIPERFLDGVEDYKIIDVL